MDWITERIAIGNIDDAMAKDALRNQGVTAVLGLNDFATFFPKDGFAWTRVNLIDGEGNPPEDVQRALTTLAGFLADGHRVLVHCREGKSRAPFVVSCHLASHHGWDFDTAFAFVAERRTVVNLHPALRLLWPQLDSEAGADRQTRRTGHRKPAAEEPPPTEAS